MPTRMTWQPGRDGPTLYVYSERAACRAQQVEPSMCSRHEARAHRPPARPNSSAEAANMTSSPAYQVHQAFAFATRKAAEHAYRHFVDVGVPRSDMSLFVQAQQDPEGEALDHAIEVGGAIGAAASAVAGGAGGALAGLGLLAAPGIGPLLALGPLAAGMTGAIMGATAGGLIGSLIGAGLSETRARLAAQRLAAGRAIIVIVERSWDPRARAALEAAKDFLCAFGDPPPLNIR